MKTSVYLLGLTALVSLCVPVRAQSPEAAATASVIVTLEPKRSKEIPAINPVDLRVQVNRKPVTVTGLTPVGDAPLQLLILIDDSARFSFGSEIKTIQSFIRGLAPTTEIGIGYMRNGTVDMVQAFTPDHDTAAQKVRLTLGSGGADVSPYDSISEAIRRWQSASRGPRRNIILISSGIEGYGGGFAPQNPYVNKTIKDAQLGGVIVYSIYNPSVGHFGHAMWRQNVGQNLLSQLSDETGGDLYNYMFGAAVDFSPYLKEIESAIAHQYLLSFAAPPVKKPGLQEFQVKITEKDADADAPSRVFVR